MREGCADIVPALFFLDAVGLNGAFSTFRASAIWYDRAKVLRATHKTVALVHSVTQERIGRARVVDAHRGPFWALMEKHAASNHLFAGKGLTDAEASVQLQDWIRRNMGSRFVKEQDALGTVLYLERIA